MKKHIIIAISGKMGSGKTTLAESLVEKYAGVHLKFADPLYRMHEAIRNILDDYGYIMKPKDGKLLQLLGTEWGRETLGQNIWADLTENRIKQEIDDSEELEQEAFIVVDDLRFDNELNLFKSIQDPRFKIIKIRLEASEEIRRERCSDWRENTAHPSEIGLDHRTSEFDMVIHTDVLSQEEVLNVVCTEIERV